MKCNNPDAPPTLCVEYLSGLSVYQDYVAFEHRGQARTFAERFWFAFGGEAPVPIIVDEALARKDELDRPYEISVSRNGKFWNVTERRLRRADGSCVEIDRFYQTWTIHSRAEAFRASTRSTMRLSFEQRRSAASRPNSRRCARCAAGTPCGSAARRHRTAGRSLAV